MNTKTIQIPFSGFYESLHSGAVDSTLEDMGDFEGNGGVEDWFTSEQIELMTCDGVDFAAIYKDYAKAYAAEFNQYASQELGFELGLTFESLSSPREYNYTTDRIFMYIPTATIEKLSLVREANPEVWAKVLADKFTSYDGFASFYSNDPEAWQEKPLDEYDHNELLALLEANLIATGVDLEQLDYEILFNQWEPSSNGEIDDLIAKHSSPEALAAYSLGYAKYEEHQAKEGQK